MTIEFEKAVRKVLAEVESTLLEKNRQYGNSALDPLRIFSKASTIEQLYVRIDDKLSRVKRGLGESEDVILDLLGKQRCLECRFWKQETGEYLFSGHCHRYAPRCGNFNDWPPVYQDDWCGDFDIADPDEITDRKAIIEKEYPTKEQ